MCLFLEGRKKLKEKGEKKKRSGNSSEEDSGGAGRTKKKQKKGSGGVGNTSGASGGGSTTGAGEGSCHSCSFHTLIIIMNFITYYHGVIQTSLNLSTVLGKGYFAANSKWPTHACAVSLVVKIHFIRK